MIIADDGYCGREGGGGKKYVCRRVLKAWKKIKQHKICGASAREKWIYYITLYTIIFYRRRRRRGGWCHLAAIQILQPAVITDRPAPRASQKEPLYAYEPPKISAPSIFFYSRFVPSVLLRLSGFSWDFRPQPVACRARWPGRPRRNPRPDHVPYKRCSCRPDR